MLQGGIADKLGNRYEAKWLVRQLFRVLYEERTWLRFEGITTAFGGFEFGLGFEGKTEWHQTKKTSPHGNWTIKALEREGVLSAFKNRLYSSGTDTCFFVSEAPAKDAQVLSQKADVANDLAEFEGSLSQGQARAFTDLSAIWDVEKVTAWRWLRRSSFLVETTLEIESHILVMAQYAFENTDGNSAFESLRDYMEKRLNVEVTTEGLRDDLRKHPRLRFKDWALDPTIRERVRQETQYYAFAEFFGPLAS